MLDCDLAELYEVKPIRLRIPINYLNIAHLTMLLLGIFLTKGVYGRVF